MMGNISEITNNGENYYHLKQGAHVSSIKQDWHEYLEKFAGKRVIVCCDGREYGVNIPEKLESLQYQSGTYNTGYQNQIRVGTIGGTSEDGLRSDKTFGKYISISNFFDAKVIGDVVPNAFC